jgi:N-formylglutamate amidohydrolase
MEQELLFEYIDGYRSACKYHFKGNVNIILSAPHGGNLMPDDVPDRTEGIYIRSSNVDNSFRDQEHCKTTVVKDKSTLEFTENVANELATKWNLKPFIIIGKWHRKKVDFNRDILEGTLNHPETILAYENYHQNLNDAIDRVNQLFGRGLLIDIHGHSQGK